MMMVMIMLTVAVVAETVGSTVVKNLSGDAGDIRGMGLILGQEAPLE